MRTRTLLLAASVTALAASACANKTPAEDPAPQAQAPSKGQDGSKVPGEADEAGAAVAAADENAEHAGCIYAEGEKDEEQAGCPHGPGEPGAPSQDEGHFGTAFSLADARPLADVIEAGAGEDPVLVAGEVEAVCQKKGCWMVIKDGTAQARVLMKDHGFAVPMDSRGKKAVVEGVLASRTFDEAQVKHLEKDGGGDPSKVSGTRTEHVLTATGIEIKS